MNASEIKVIQLNVEGISPSKRDIIAKLAHEVNADVIALQETHSTKDKQLTIDGYKVVSYTHHRQHGNRYVY